MNELDLTPQELEWLQKENVVPRTNITTPKKQVVLLDDDRKEVTIKRPRLERWLIGEVGATAISLSKGKNVVTIEDEIVLVRSKVQKTPRKSVSSHKESIVRLRNKRTDSEFGKLTLETSVFISTLLDLDICEFEASIIYFPECLKIADEILITMRIFIKSTAFSQKLGTDLEPNDQVLYRKKALISLFERTGLLDRQEAIESKLAMGDPDGVTAADLSRIYSKANLIDKALVKVEPKEGMTLELRDYQKIALSFMLTKENQKLETKGMSPLWKKMVTHEGTSIYYSPYSGELSLEFPVEHHCKGGILADEMGLGKTIEILSLIHSNPFVNRQHKLETLATLVVCPLNLASQWIEEARKCFEPVMSTFMYYGHERNKLVLESATCPMIVVTTYGTLQSEFEDSKSSPLFTHHWHRIVLDEAHLIKDRFTKTAKAAYALEGTNRWAVTGTPIINNDLYSLVHFLRVEPWCEFSFWNSFVTIPFAKRDPKALEIVQTILEPLTIRRTKDQKDPEGNPIVTLPTKTITLQRLVFSPEEQELYDKMNAYSRRRLDHLKMEGKADYLHIFSLILRLRQLCNHKQLIPSKQNDGTFFSMDLDDVLKDHVADAEFKDQVGAELKLAATRDCPICFETCSGGVLLPCLHSICKSCLDGIIERSVEALECPLCRKPCTETEIMQISEQKGTEKKITLTSLGFKMSTKLRALVKEIERIHRESPDEKMIVFSQWTSMLDICEIAFKEHQIEFGRLDGSLTQKQREKTLCDFKSNRNTLVLLATLRSSGVGLNLTVASRVFLLEPWWNEGVENQAIDRVHRLGQTRPVFVTRYVIQNTVEEKMLKIQERKSRIIGASLTGAQATNLEELLSLFD